MEDVNRIDSQDRSEFSRANILAHSDKVRQVDTDTETGLELFCYNRCTNEDSAFIRQCRGLVFHNDDLVMKAFSYALEYNQTDDLTNILTPFDQWTFFKSYEGALLRLFFFGGRWFVATHRKLNAYKSKWSSKDSFGTLLERALEKESVVNTNLANFLSKEGTNIVERFQNALDKSKQYMLLLRNTSENRIVCEPPSNGPYVFHVGTFVGGKLSMTENIHLPYPEKLTLTNLNELVQFVDSVDTRHLQGVIGININGEQVKVLNSRYQDYFRTRGNEPSVKFRYLQVRMDKKLTRQLYELYPEKATEFDTYEKILYEVAKNIHQSYMKRFVNKNREYVTVPQPHYNVIRECHSWHQTDRKNNIVTLNKVITVLNKQLAKDLNAMIHHYQLGSPQSDIPPRDYKGSRNNSPQIGSLPPPPVWKALPPPKLN